MVKLSSGADFWSPISFVMWANTKAPSGEVVVFLTDIMVDSEETPTKEIPSCVFLAEWMEKLRSVGLLNALK